MLARNIHAVPTPQPAEPLGSKLPSWSLLDEAAAAAGISPAHCLLSQAAVLAGISGSMASWRSTLGHEGLGQVSMILPAEALCLRQHIEQTLSHPLILQEFMRKRSAQLRVEVLDYVRFGTSGNSRKLNPNAMDPGTLDEHRRALLVNEIHPQGAIRHTMDADLSQAPFQIREEALLRPFFILKNVALKDLKATLAKCHNREALIIGSAGDLIPLRSSKRTMPLSKLLSSVMIDLPKDRMLRPAGHLAFVRATGILMESSMEELSAIQQKLPDALESFILPGEARETQEPSSNAHAVEWAQCSRRAARKIIDRRRQGLGYDAGMRDPDKALEFERDRLEFTQELEAQGGAASFLAFCSLPTALAWTISAFHEKHDCDDMILKFAVPTARLLLQEHRQRMLQVTASHQYGQQQPLVLRMVRRVEKLAPVSERDLVRGFNTQRMSAHRPMIEQLVDNDTLRWDQAGKLILGSAARPLLDRKEFNTPA